MQSFNITSLYVLLDLITVFLLVLFALFLLSRRDGHLFQQRMLGSFFIVLALSYMDGVFVSLNILLHGQYPYMVHYCMSFDYLVGPALYVFVLSLTQHQFKPRLTLLWHTLPFAMHLLFLLTKEASFDDTTAPLFDKQQISILVITSTSHLFIYWLLVLSKLNQYKARLTANFANTEVHSLSWLLFISCGLALAAVMRLLNNLLWLTIPDYMYQTVLDLKVIAVSCVFIFACTVIFRSLKQPVFIDYSQPEKYKSSALDLHTQATMLATIQQYMLEKSPYLEASFSLKQLADETNLKAYQVSQVLNVTLQQNFFDFVNSYRIDASKRLLTEKSALSKNITQIMYETGFNSKSVFNTVFKKMTGLTPSQFRKSAF
ncbi:helix-turn-helix domain-containing protein [Alteromonadaceae bacterium BrNp21-10]|nr:helix-turn-helix domain-containing protein [Alteromonadaceae bacterium BrNp21-10]